MRIRYEGTEDVHPPLTALRAPFALLEGRDINLDPELHICHGKIAFGQRSIHVGGDVGGPGVMERCPRTPNAERRMKVVSCNGMVLPSVPNRINSHPRYRRSRRFAVLRSGLYPLFAPFFALFGTVCT